MFKVRLGDLASPAPKDPHDLTQFLVPDLKLDNFKDFGLSSSDFSIVDPERKIVVHAGNNVNAHSVMKGLTKVSEGSMKNRFPGHVFLVKNGTASVLVFGNVPLSENVFSCHDTVWNDEGMLVPVWYSGAIPSPSQTQFGDYVEKSGKSSVLVGRRRGVHDAFAVKGPSAVLFVDASKKAGDSSKINPEQARALSKELGVNHDAIVEKITSGKIPVFSAAPPKSDTAQWIEKMIK